MNDNNNIILLVVLAVLVLGGAFWWMKSKAPAPAPAMKATNTIEEAAGVQEDTDTTEKGGAMKAETSKEVTLAAVAGSKTTQNGSAVLEEEGGKVVVTVKVAPVLQGAQPAHFHTGTCAKPGDVVYPLKDVVNGMSTTTLDVSMKELTAKLPLILNVHKSAAEVAVYTACGEVK